MSNLDDLEYIRSIDKSNMIGLIQDYPAQISLGIDVAEKLEIPKGYNNFSKIVATGMGGSGIPGDYLRVLLKDELDIPFVGNKQYELPRFVDKDTLVLAISYSGTTEETIAAFHYARKAGAKIIGLTSGATLGELCKQYDVPCMIVPAGRQTRTSFGYLISAAMMVLQQLKITSNKQVQLEKSIETLKQMKEELKPDVPANKNNAKSIALGLHERIPIVYGVRDFTDAVALRWKQEFNENSKLFAGYDSFPELNHNELVAFDSPLVKQGLYKTILLRHEGETPKITKRMELTKKILTQRKLDFIEVFSRGQSPTEKLLSLTYIGDIMSVYLAVARGVDPTPVGTISSIREIMSKEPT